MVYCPNCGEQVSEGAVYCSNCGASLTEGDDHATTSEGPREPASGAGQERTDEYRQSGQSGPPAEYGSPPSASQPGPPEAPPTEADAGISRRGLLAAGGGLVVLGGAGWFFFLRSDHPDSPEGVADRSWSTWANSDASGYRELFHPESPARDSWDEEYWDNFGPGQGVDWSVENREIVEQSDSEAVLREVYLWNNRSDDSTEQVRITWRYRFRKDDGDWKIWDYEFVDEEPAG